MGPVNWMAVILAALAASAVVLGFQRRGGVAHSGWVLAASLVSSAMLGHALARIGAEKLAVKWWLYFMQSGGLALAFVIPAIWVSLSQHGASRAALRESGMWLAAYLAMGAVFRILG